MLWLNRLSAVLSQPFDLISLVSSGEAPFRGRYLRFANAVYGIGRLVASGGEALVYELVDLDASTLAGVVKICRFPPGSPEYRRWAVPIRFEGNAHSRLADIELHPASLLEVPGGLVKVQEYVAVDPSDDWATGASARPIYEPGLELTARLEIADGLLRQHGDHGVLLEARGMILAELERDEEAVVTLERAADLFRSESHAGVLRVAPLLAFCHRRLYHQKRWEGAGVVMTIPGLGSQVIYSDPEAAALEDSREDRSLYVGLEALDVEPYSIPNLAVVAEELMGSWASVGRVESVLQAIERAAPGHPRAVEIREALAAMVSERTNVAERPAASATPSSGPDAESSGPDAADGAPQPPGGERQQDAAREPSPGTDPEGYMSRFELAYEPEPERGQTVEARVTSAYANLAVGRHAQAELAARGALALDSDHAGAHIALARVLCASERLAEAESLMTEAIGSMSSEGDIYAELGAIKLQAEKFEEARTMLLRGLVSEPNDPWGVRFNLGKACRKLGRREEAVRWLRECADEEPTKAFASIELAYALRGEPEPDVDEALRVVGQALARSPSDADLLVCRAQLLGMQGDWAQVIADLEQAVASAPDHPIAAKFLAALRDPSSGIHV
jgi:tetratricopeptide (TPR) repeat protein